MTRKNEQVRVDDSTRAFEPMCIAEEAAARNRVRTKRTRIALLLSGVLLLGVFLAVWIGITQSRKGMVQLPFGSEAVVGESRTDIAAELATAGFSNVKSVAVDSGWLWDDSVICITVAHEEQFDKGDYHDPAVPILIKYSSHERIDITDPMSGWQTRDYEAVIENLELAGFTSITVQELITSDKNRDRKISTVELNGEVYTKGHCYLPKDAPIEVSYYSLRIPISNDNAAFVGQNYKEVVRKLQEDGFQNVQEEQIKTGWAEGNSVVSVSINNLTSYREGDTYGKDTKIVVKYSSDDRISASEVLNRRNEMDFEELKTALRREGFINLSVTPVETAHTEMNHGVSEVVLHGEVYRGGECYLQHGAPIEIRYYAAKIPVGLSASDMKGENYTQVVAALQAKGFTNITLKRANDLIIGWFHKEGDIQRISINGQSGFSATAAFASDAEIVIVVHTFKNRGCEEITETA